MYRKWFGGILGGEARAAVLGAGWQQRAVTLHTPPLCRTAAADAISLGRFPPCVAETLPLCTRELPGREQLVDPGGQPCCPGSGTADGGQGGRYPRGAGECLAWHGWLLNHASGTWGREEISNGNLNQICASSSELPSECS